MRTAAVAWIVVLGVLADTAPADVIDQNQPSARVYMAGFAEGGLAQSFQQSVNNITGAGIHLSGAGDRDTVTIQLWDHLPNLGGRMIAEASALGMVDTWVDVFWGPTAIAANTTYYLVFTGNTTLGITGDPYDPYPFGHVYANRGFEPFPDYDYTFRTWAVPAPSAMWLLGMGGIFARRRRSGEPVHACLLPARERYPAGRTRLPERIRMEQVESAARMFHSCSRGTESRSGLGPTVLRGWITNMSFPADARTAAR